MADAFDARAALSIAVDLRQALNDMETFRERGGDLDDLFDRVGASSREAARFIEKTTGALRETGTAARAARKDLGPGAEGASDEWRALAGRIREAEDAYRAISKTQAAAGGAPVDPRRFMASQGVSGQDVAQYRQGSGANLLADESKQAAAQVRSLAQAERELADQASPRLRYALYDVATTARTTSIALGGATIAVAALAAAQESAFTNVERTLDGSESMGVEGVAALRSELMGLTREIPLTFTQVSEIATLGNQLGITSGEVAGFTETTARFAAVTGLTVEASATAFGALGELLRNTDGTELRVDQFENLGSAIALVGRRSVATEAEIVSMSTRLAASATSAGFSAQEVIALSGALASLRVAPERAQGVMEVYFNRLNTAIANGGARLDSFASVAGVATGEVEGLVRSNPVEFFERVAVGLGKMDSISRTGALEALGLQGIRAGEVFGRVASNVDVFNKALGDSNQGWTEGTELSSQFNKVLDDLASRWQIFVNALAEAGGAIGATLAPNIIKAIDALSGLLQMLASFAESPFGAYMFRLAGTAAALFATLAGIGSVAAVWAGSLFAMRLAAIELGIVTAGTSRGVGGLIASLLGLRTAGTVAAAGAATAGNAAAGAAGGMRTLAGAALTARGALIALGRATIVIGIVTAAADLLFGLADSANGAGAATGGLAEGFGLAAGAGDELTDTLAGLDWEAPTDGAEGLGGAAEDAAQKVRTLADYANDLQTVMKRSTDIRFGSDQSFDSILSGWQKIRDAAHAAREAAAAHQRKLSEMGADRSIKQYWLSVAVNYKDELRAAKLRAELAELDADMAAEKKNLAAEQAKANKSLVGNNAAAAENRGEILGLVGNYQSYLQSLAASGTSQEELIRIAARLRGEFVNQATGLGYNRAEIEKYAKSFGDMGTIIQHVPRNITVEFNGDPAMQALSEFMAQAATTAASGGAGAGAAFGEGFDLGLGENTGGRKMGDAVGRSIAIAAEGGLLDAFYAGDELAIGVADTFDNRLKADMGEIDVIRSGWANEQQTLGQAAGGQVGSKTSGGVRAGLEQGLKGYNPTGNWANGQGANAWNSGVRLGSQVGGGLAEGLRATLAGRRIGAKFDRGTGSIQVDGAGFSGGGYTGGASSSEVRGAVHGKEFVFNADATRTIGVNNLAFMHRMAKQGKAVAPAGIGAGGGGPMDISASSARLLADLLAANLQLILPGAALAGSVGSHNVVTARRGAA
ncbi:MULTISPECIES: phage tail tape measure protein [unclassified Microbacterium]|uniref:phage tail tape measure protein n=1 Tax=unclassified Microbacterium TaxID=2609290 RepID=UPI001602C181|nr:MULTISPECIES: phage tail tape measure protein [unclassified Microbacterium]MBT2484854.1 phage tail tape measure protein [Microbacterium sp. ISL-108]